MALSLLSPAIFASPIGALLERNVVLFYIALAVYLYISMQIAIWIAKLQFAYLIPKLIFGIDIRKMGSGNPGTTNMYRSLQEVTTKTNAIILTIAAGLLEVGKGAVMAFLPFIANFSYAVCIYSILIGGKGVATFLGACLGTARHPLCFIAPVLWATLTFTPLAKLIPAREEWVNLGLFEIKRTFLMSIIAMGFATTGVILTSDINTIIVCLMSILYILFAHRNYLRLVKWI